MTTLLVRFAKDVELKIKKENLYLNCVNTEDIEDKENQNYLLEKRLQTVVKKFLSLKFD